MSGEGNDRPREDPEVGLDEWRVSWPDVRAERQPLAQGQRIIHWVEPGILDIDTPFDRDESGPNITLLRWRRMLGYDFWRRETVIRVNGKSRYS